MAGGAAEQVKRRLLAELVAENLALQRGEVLRPPRARRRRGLGSTVGLPFLVLAPLALLVAAGGATWSPELPMVVSALPRPAPVAVATPAAPPGSERTFEAPTPVPAAALPLSVRRIVLDPGHGGSQPGAVGPLGLVEKEVTLDLARRLETLLSTAGFEVVLTRVDDEGVTLAERARRANEAAGDLFVSIHLNWIVNRKVRGVETYYLGPSDDPYLNELVAVENRNSGLSLSELRPLLDQIYLSVRGDQSRQVAEAVQRSLYRSLLEVNPGLSDRGVKTAPFVVLAKTEMPAILAEVSCLSNEREAELLSKPLYRQFIAEALFTGLAAYAEQAGGSVTEGGSGPS
jgi:N-acetylmuramoyl-L-alanine amidase